MIKKNRRTKNQKLRTEAKRQSGFTINQEWLSESNGNQSVAKEIKVDNRYFRADLTKTFVLTMLVLALELALWNYLSRR